MTFAYESSPCNSPLSHTHRVITLITFCIKRLTNSGTNWLFSVDYVAPSEKQPCCGQLFWWGQPLWFCLAKIVEYMTHFNTSHLSWPDWKPLGLMKGRMGVLEIRKMPFSYRGADTFDPLSPLVSIHQFSRSHPTPLPLRQEQGTYPLPLNRLSWYNGPFAGISFTSKSTKVINSFVELHALTTPVSGPILSDTLIWPYWRPKDLE